MRIALADEANNRAAAAAIRAPARRQRGAAKPSSNGHHLSEFSELYHQYYPKLFAYVYGRVQDRELSLDLVSDVFEKAFMKKEFLRSQDAFGSWLFTIARNEVASHWRKEKPAAKAIQDAAWETELNHQPRSPEETLLHKERIDHLSVLLRQLPPREQEIISLKFDAEITNREIAAVLNTSEVNVRVTIFRALHKLRQRMERTVQS